MSSEDKKLLDPVINSERSQLNTEEKNEIDKVDTEKKSGEDSNDINTEEKNEIDKVDTEKKSEEDSNDINTKEKNKIDDSDKKDAIETQQPKTLCIKVMYDPSNPSNSTITSCTEPIKGGKTQKNKRSLKPLKRKTIHKKMKFRKTPKKKHRRRRSIRK